MKRDTGNNLLREHLNRVAAEGLPIRLVVARTDDTATVDAGGDASKVKKTFAVREDLVGTLVEFDGDTFVVDFVKT